MGDGIAGLGAAIVLARAGWQVDCARPPAQRASHRRHAHLTSAAVMAQLEQLTGAPLDGWAFGTAAVWDDSGRRDDAARPVVSAEALCASLADVAAAAGVAWREDVRLASPSGRTDWRWSARGYHDTADLLVDASGSGHLLGRLAGVAVTIEELSGTDRCWSWTGSNDGQDTPWLLACRSVRGSAMLLRGPDGVVRLTLRDRALGASGAAPDPAAALDRLMLGAGAHWLGRIGAITLRASPLRHDSPLARRTAIAHAAALPPLARVGDALLQTAPRLGQGIAQITQQLAALAARLADGTPPGQLHTALEPLVERRWAGLTMSAGLGLGFTGRIAA